MQCHGVPILDQFAEAFRMWACRLVVTAVDDTWLRIAAQEVTGYGTSVIGCDAEAGVERWLSPRQTPDGRPGVALLFFAFNAKALAKTMPNRVGQCLMTCPTTAVYDGMPEVDAGEDSARLDLGAKLRYFGDGLQKSKVIALSSGRPRRFWRVPVMEGEFVCEHRFGAVKAIGGGNLLICGVDQASALSAARQAVAAVADLPDVITPFPGGVVRSGSKVGSRYKALFASTNDPWSPAVRSRSRSLLPPDAGAVYEIVINGLSQGAIAGAMRLAIDAACRCPGVVGIGAGNYGGNLGKFHFHLRQVLEPAAPPPAPAAAPRQPDGPGYTLTWKGTLAPGDGAALRPDTLGPLPPAELAALPLRVGRELAPLGELFDIAGGPAPAERPTLTLRGLPRLPLLGADMARGELHLWGDAGDDLGASMSGGIIRVHGHAGHRVGGPAPGHDRGMTGGEIVIDGTAADHVGFCMRRGLIAVAGSVGRSPGYRMLAGTVVVGLGPLDHPGLEMRRGTLLCLDPREAQHVPPGFTLDHTFVVAEVVALRLLLRRLQELGLPLNLQALPPRALACSGDKLELHRGELWQWTR